MFHVLRGIYTNIMSTQPNEQDPTIIVPLDLDILWKHIQAHFGMTGNLKIYHSEAQERLVLFKAKQVHNKEIH